MPLITQAEAVGLFLFAVGIYGGTYRGVARHLAIHGVFPVDGLYLGLMLLGSGLMIFGRCLEPATTWFQGLLRGLRLGFSLVAVAAIAWWMAYL
ncbi:MAG: hypothetical protein VKQ33_07945 [Candidatus Sericytochromatia bacterium]|nr:hypothetical protein [Candidatus Sericytochromatia bacterium]